MAAVPDLGGLDREAAIGRLRRAMGRIGPAAHPAAPAVRALPTPPELSGVLAGTLIRGEISTLDAPGTLLCALLAAVTAAGGHAAVAGVPGLLPAVVAERGGDLDRLLLVPDPGAEPLTVLGTLAEGVDLLVADLGAPPPAAARRRLRARLRDPGAALVQLGPAWPGSVARLGSRVLAVEGPAAGAGRIRAVRHLVHAAPAGRPERRAHWLVGGGPATAEEAAPGRLRVAR